VISQIGDLLEVVPLDLFGDAVWSLAIVKIQPTGTHEQVAGFLAMEISFEIKHLNLPLFIPRQGLIKAIDTDKTAYIAVLSL
jgi:hypothetical protein